MPVESHDGKPTQVLSLDYSSLPTYWMEKTSPSVSDFNKSVLMCREKSGSQIYFILLLFYFEEKAFLGL